MDSAFGGRYPALYEWLTLTVLEGKGRQTATLLVFCEQGRFKACVADREGDCSFFRASESFEGLLAAVEAALADGTADWRARQRGGKR